MKTVQIVDAIKALSLTEKLFIVEQIFKDLRKATLEEEQQQRKRAAELLLADYQQDEDLTAFAVLDKENFYEAK